LQKIEIIAEKEGTVDYSTSARVPRSYAELTSFADEELMLMLRDGHHDALAVLFDRYHRLVFSVGWRILHDAAEAEDLMQSVFLEIFRSVAQFDASKGTTKVWILQYAYHRAFNRKKYLNLRAGQGCEDDLHAIEWKSGSSVTSISRLECGPMVREALTHLSKLQRRTLEFVFYEGLTMHETAERTGESFDSIRHQYYRGLEKLRSILCEDSEASTKKLRSRKAVACSVMNGSAH
jgi:RNA polymerase sigma-70 factor (ECF subfamily)